MGLAEMHVHSNEGYASADGVSGLCEGAPSRPEHRRKKYSVLLRLLSQVGGELNRYFTKLFQKS